MRTVTIERKKSLVGALVPFTVYAEDHASSELIIHEVPCKKIGELKNGEQISFEIGDAETCIFAVPAAQVSYPELIRVPAGTEPVALSGKCVSAASGISFRFDGNDTDEVRELHKSRSKGAVLGIILSVVLSALVAFGLSVGRSGIKSCASNSEKTFSVQEMSVTLTSAFKQESMLGFAGYLHSKDVAVFVERIGFDEVEGLEEISAREFAGYALLGNDYGTDVTVESEGGIPYFEFADKDPSSGEKTRTYVAFYKSDSAIWDIQFVSLEKDYPKQRSNFVKWAKTVTFDN